MKQSKILSDKQLTLVLAHRVTQKYTMRDRAIVLISHLVGLRANEIVLLAEHNSVGENVIRDEFF